MTKYLTQCLFFFLFDVPTLLAENPSTTESFPYGVDVSWPIHASRVSTNYPWLPHNVDPQNNAVPPAHDGSFIQHLGNRQKVYEDYIQGCRDYFEEAKQLCDNEEEYRLYMNLGQPRSMVNFTDVGYKKIRAPDSVFKLLKDFWEKNQGREYDETWRKGSVAANYWEIPTSMLSVENEELEGGGEELKDTVWKLAENSIREWTNMDLQATSLYGIRIYKEGSILSHHVDRLPLISSAIINVAQDVDEDWPIEVIGHDGLAHNITMEPGDMILYESHSIIHGRPFPLKGRYYANVFIHFEPVKNSIDQEIKDSDNNLPFYIVPGSDGELFLESESEDYDSEDVESEDYDFGHVESEDVESEDYDFGHVESEDVESEDYDFGHVGSEDYDFGHVESEDIESEDFDSEDVESDDIVYEHIYSQDVQSDDIESEEFNSEDVETDDIESEEINSEDVEIDDIESEDTDNTVLSSEESGLEHEEL